MAHRGRAVAVGFAIAVLVGSLVATLPAESAATSATLGRSSLGLAASPLPALTHAAAAPAAPPAAPRPAAETLTEDGASPSLLSLSWTESTGLTFGSYSIDQSTTSSGGPWTTVATITTETDLSDGLAELTPGSTSWWEVVASGLGGSTSNVVQVTQPNASALTDWLPGGTEAELNWTNNASYGGNVGFVAYDVYESVDDGPASTVASVPTVSTHSYTLTGLSGGSGYSIYVETVDCIACGTGSALQAGTDSNTVTFGTPLPLSVTVHEDRATVDVGEADLFSCTPSGGTTPYNYSWDNGSGTAVPGNESERFTFAAPGNATVACVVTDASHTVVSEAAPLVTINSDPSARLTTSEATPDAGEVVSLTCTPSGGTAPFLGSYDWNFGDGTDAITTTPTASHAYAAAAPGGEGATCLATDDALVTAEGSLTVTPFPALHATISVGAETVAPGTALALTATLTGGSSDYVRDAWALPDGSDATTASFAYTFAATPVAAVFGFNGTDSVGGTASASVTVNVTPLTVQRSDSASSVQTGHGVAFQAYASGGAGGPYHYLWSFGDGAVSTDENATHAYSAAGTFTPTLEVTDRLGAANSSKLPAVTVSTPPPLVPTWVLALLAIVIIAAVVVLLVVRRRRRAAEKMRSSVPWAPPTAPNATVRGSKVCPSCGTSNVPLRTTCEVCGADLPKSRSSG